MLKRLLVLGLLVLLPVFALAQGPTGGTIGAGGPSGGSGISGGISCVGCKADVQFVPDATVTNASSTVTTSGGDVAFTSSDSTKACFATSSGGPASAHIAGKLSMAQGTFTFSSAHAGTCTVANAFATGAANNYFIWATDDTAALTTWWTTMNPSGALCKTGLLPATPVFTTTNFGSAAAPVCKTAITGPGNEGISVQGFGQLDSIIVIGPNFDPTTCTGAGTGNICFFAGVGISISNFGMWGGERGDCPSTYNGKGLLIINGDTHIFNFTAAGWCAGTTNTSVGIATTGSAGSAAQQSGIIIDGWGNTCLSIGASFIPIVNSWFGDCNQGGVTIGANVVFNSTGNTFGDVGVNRPMVAVAGAGGVFQSTNDTCFDSSAVNMVGVQISANAIANINNFYCDVSVATTSYAIWVNGGTANLNMVRVKGGSGTGNDLIVDTSGIVNVGLGNKFMQGAGHFTVTAGAGTVIADGHSLIGACTGVATAASTLGLYGTGPNETLTTCTFAAIGTGEVIPQARALQNLVVTTSAAGTNASSGLVTVLVNGAASTIVCTVGTGTSCADNTHQVALAAGDLVSFRFTSQAADTLAGVKAFVMWN